MDDSFGEFVRETRESLGISSAAFSDLVGVSAEYIRRIERGKSPSSRVRTAIIRELGMALKDVIKPLPVIYVVYGNCAIDCENYSLRRQVLRTVSAEEAIDRIIQFTDQMHWADIVKEN